MSEITCIMELKFLNLYILDLFTIIYENIVLNIIFKCYDILTS